MRVSLQGSSRLTHPDRNTYNHYFSLKKKKMRRSQAIRAIRGGNQRVSRVYLPQRPILGIQGYTARRKAPRRRAGFRTPQKHTDSLTEPRYEKRWSESRCRGCLVIGRRRRNSDFRRGASDPCCPRQPVAVFPRATSAYTKSSRTAQHEVAILLRCLVSGSCSRHN